MTDTSSAPPFGGCVPARVHRIARISRVVADLDRAQAFYRNALTFRPIAQGSANLPAAAAFDMSPDETVVMRLGCQEIGLARFAIPGRPYPADSRANDLWFQHLAIVVDDMDAAYAHLSAWPGWRPISCDGPELLPPETGGVKAFKFRDPDGHPLELIWFPPNAGRAVWRQTRSETPFLGIDHTAISVASTSRAVDFYRGLGFTVGGGSHNHGAAQSRLDGLTDARVEVTSLRPEAEDSAGLELLGYGGGRRAEDARVNDILTDWVTLVVRPSGVVRRSGAPRAVRDPDGHRLVLCGQGSGATGSPA